MSPARENPDLLGTLAIVVIGAVVLKQVSEGKLSLPGLSLPRGVGLGQPSASQPSEQPANRGDNHFDFTIDSFVHLVGGTGHVAFNHRGPGGTFRLLVESRANGGFFGIGATAWGALWDSQFTVGDDGDDTGYGIEITFPTAVFTASPSVRATIYGLRGEPYTTMEMPG